MAASGRQNMCWGMTRASAATTTVATISQRSAAEPALLAHRGAVDPDVALAMAEGARGLLGCDLAVATTGVAGPDGVDGKPVGLVFVALSGPQGGTVTRLSITGSRARIRSDTVAAALRLVQRVLDAEHPFRPVVGQGEYLSLQEAPSMRRDDDSAPA